MLKKPPAQNHVLQLAVLNKFHALKQLFEGFQLFIANRFLSPFLL